MDDRVRDAFSRARVLLEEEGVVPIFMGVRGSVVYELPGTHKDVDVRVVYLASTDGALSIRKPQHTIERMDLPLDLVGWEAERFFHHLLKHNGNMVELLHTPIVLTWWTEEGSDLRRLASKFVTKKLSNYYRGYAASQFKRAQNQVTTGKGGIYTYREMYAGIWLLRTGELVFPWAELREKVEEAGYFRSELIDEFDMDKQRLTDHILMAMRGEFDALTLALDEAVAESPLPESYDGYEECNRLLLRWRRSM